jgi:hypothetical protein
MTNQVEVFSLTTADGNTLYFTGGIFSLKDWGSFGSPPTEFLTKRGYKQDGATELGYLLGGRDVQISLYRASTTDRNEYWANRAELLDFLRPNRNGPLTLTVLRPDESLRSITVRANPGLTFPPNQQSDNSWGIDDSIDFIAFDPLWYDASTTELVMSAASQTQLVFPITFPISFGTSNEQFTSGVISYLGTWKSHPTITLTGPYTTATITNETTGASIFMSVAIPLGEQRICLISSILTCVPILKCRMGNKPSASRWSMARATARRRSSIAPDIMEYNP